MIALLLVAALLTPNHSLTPGVMDPATTKEQVCTPGYASSVRHVSGATKRKVYRSYGINPRVGGPYEVDHLISLELGGTNDIQNLWPQSYVSTPFNARMKDRLEDRLHFLVCRGDLTLLEAQEEIADDWISAYNRYIPQ